MAEKTYTLADDLRKGGYEGKMYVKYHLGLRCMDLGRDSPFYYEILDLSLDFKQGPIAEVKVFSNDGKKFLRLGWNLEKLLHDERTSQNMRERILAVNSREARVFAPTIPNDYCY